MPLIKSSSDQAFKTNVRNLMNEVGTSPHVKSRSQALAIAYSVKRRGKADGGNIVPISPNIDEINRNNRYDNAGGFLPHVPKAGVLPISPTAKRNNPATRADGGFVDAQKVMDTVRMQNLLLNALGKNPKPVNRDMGGALLRPSTPGMATRAEARGMVHSGPIMSAVPGRTDKHPLNVKSGAYVFPSEHVASLGQGNTMAGMAILKHMFSVGPYTGALMKPKMGAGPPKPHAPRMMSPTDRGGARGHTIGVPTPIAAAGGEYVLDPEHILAWMHRNKIPGGLKEGHRMLDAWVMKQRKTHIRTLRTLPPPAKS